MEKVYIVAAKRSAIGSFLGTLSKIPAADFSGQVLKETLKQAQINPNIIDEVIIGHVLSAGQKQGFARQVSLKAGIPVTVPSYTVDMVCGSGMRSVADGYSHIVSGLASIVITGGIEAMSQAPYLTLNVRQGLKMGTQTMYDHMLHDSLIDAFSGEHMGLTTEPLAEALNITREQQDQFAYQSQLKARFAQDNGLFKDEIIPLTIEDKKGTVVFEHDEYINYTTTLEKMTNLKPAFKKDGTITAGNASGINDGASFIVLASEKAVRLHGLVPMAEVVSFAQTGIEPSQMGLAPVATIKQALTQANLTLNQMDSIEINESFALQVLAVTKTLAKDLSIEETNLLAKVNPKGGAIALGHPVGASGNRIIVTLLHSLFQDNDAKYGLASLCIGGGMGTAMILKKV